jgi:hypothetical protein
MGASERGFLGRSGDGLPQGRDEVRTWLTWQVIPPTCHWPAQEESTPRFPCRQLMVSPRLPDAPCADSCPPGWPGRREGAAPLPA